MPDNMSLIFLRFQIFDTHIATVFRAQKSLKSIIGISPFDNNFIFETLTLITNFTFYFRFEVFKKAPSFTSTFFLVSQTKSSAVTEVEPSHGKQFFSASKPSEAAKDRCSAAC